LLSPKSISRHTDFQDTDGETALIPSEIMRYSLDQVSVLLNLFSPARV